MIEDEPEIGVAGMSCKSCSASISDRDPPDWLRPPSSASREHRLTIGARTAPSWRHRGELVRLHSRAATGAQDCSSRSTKAQRFCVVSCTLPGSLPKLGKRALLPPTAEIHKQRALAVGLRERKDAVDLFAQEVHIAAGGERVEGQLTRSQQRRAREYAPPLDGRPQFSRRSAPGELSSHNAARSR